MVKDTIPESELQQWFENAVNGEGVVGAIQNISDLEDRLDRLTRDFKTTDQVAREGLENALDICSQLNEAEPLSANESIALQEFNQMRPDLVLHTSNAHYLLVELKTRPGPERQGVQELLAYSAAIKMQMPYVNETLYVIVAQAWDTLLSFSVRALIMDGKRVLPLQWSRPAPGEFKFDIRLELFEYDFVHDYDPFYAMSASIFACTHPNFGGPIVSAYFGWHAQCAVADCRRLQQTGFLITWSRDRNQQFGLLSTALLTLNQHWMESEYLPSRYTLPFQNAKPGIVRVITRQAKRAVDAVWAGADKVDSSELDIWRINRAAYEHSRRFPQNSVSYEILERRRSRMWERSLTKKDARVSGFETRDFANLKRFLTLLEDDGSIRVEQFTPFGELEDFVLKSGHWPWSGDLDDILTIMHLFREYKGYCDTGHIASASDAFT